MLTTLFPMVQIKKGIWEIDEFDAASMFLIEGSEKAMLIDLGMGIGDLRGCVDMLTDKPLIVVISHGHVDHTGHAREFDEVWINEKDAGAPMPQSLARRKYDTGKIAQRQKGSIGAPYNLFRLYPYDINVDLRTDEDKPMPKINYLTDGLQFDLGGGKIITAYDCPGHSAGEMIFLDEQDRMLFAGDAVNYNLGVGACPLETTLKYMKRMASMSDKYDGIWNGHHDFRALGAPLDEDCLPTVISMMEDIIAGKWAHSEVPSFWGQPMPLSAEPPVSDAPPMNPDKPMPMPKKSCYRKGRNFLNFNPNNIFA